MQTMTVKEAWSKSKLRITLGNSGHYFAEVGWKSPENGREQKRILVTICGNRAIEIGLDGAFRDAYPADADHYFPIEIKGEKSRRKYVAKFIEELAAQIR